MSVSSDKSKNYKNCLVPQCNSTTSKTPNKLFIRIPSKKELRTKWLQLAKYHNDVSVDSALNFCEDHFDLPNDMENYIRYRIMGSVKRVLLKPGCLPSKFDCQTGTKTSENESFSHTTNDETSHTSVPYVCVEPFMCTKSTQTKIYFRSVGVQSCVKLTDRSTSPFKTSWCTQSKPSSIRKVNTSEYADNIEPEDAENIEPEDAENIQSENSENIESEDSESDNSTMYAPSTPTNSHSDCSELYDLKRTAEEEAAKTREAIRRIRELPSKKNQEVKMIRLGMDVYVERCVICESTSNLKPLNMEFDGSYDKVDSSLGMLQYCFNLEFPEKNVFGNLNKICLECYTQLCQCWEFKKKSCSACRKLRTELLDRTETTEMSAGLDQNQLICEFDITNIKTEQIIPIQDGNFESCFSDEALHRGGNEIYLNDNVTTIDSVTHGDVKFEIQSGTERRHSSKTLAKEVTSRSRNKVKKKHSKKRGSRRVHSLGRTNKRVSKGRSDQEGALSDCSVNTDEIYIATGYYARQPDTPTTSPPSKLDEGCLCCPVCNKTFTNFNLTNQHYLTHFPKHLCHICGKTVGTSRSYTIHMQTHEIKTYEHVCKPCNKSFKTKETLKKHMRYVHRRVKPFTCYHCPQQFTASLSRVIHMHKEHNIPCQFYTCEECQIKFYAKASLKNHVSRLHSGEMNFFCDLCGNGFVTKQEIKCHIMYKHTDKSDLPQCEICKKSYSSRKGLVQHMRIHLNIKTYKCSYCDQAFVQKSLLDCHLKKYHRKH